MAIKGWGGDTNISGSGYQDKIATLTTQMGTTKSGTNAYNIAQILNLYTPSPSVYDYSSNLKSTINTQYLFDTCVFSSLAHLRAPVINVSTEDLSYYNGHSSGHYITIVRMDKTSTGSEIRVHDPNYNASYYGIWNVDKTELYTAMNALVCDW